MIRVVSAIPAWLTDEGMIEEWRKQDKLQAVARSYATGGMITDCDVRQVLNTIQLYPSLAAQDDALELLEVMVINGHPHRMAADVLKELRAAQNELWKVLYG
jgi:hypothetical protein